MQYTWLGKTELHVSRIAYGTWQFGGDWGPVGPAQRHAAQATVEQAVELGINFFDTAQAYGFGLAEQLLGEALAPVLKSRRELIVLATKGGLRMDGAQLVRDSSPSWLRRGVEQSLRNLGVDYIDLYQVHWPDAQTPIEETARALDQLVQEGKIRYVGVSNYDAAQMRVFEETRKLDALQPPYSLLRREVEHGILPYCQARGIGVLAYGPLAHGMLAGTYTAATTFPPDDWRSKNANFRGATFQRNLAVVGKLKRLAEGLGMTVGQLAVAWVLAQPAVDVAIVGARNAQQLAQLTPAAHRHLTPAVLYEIESIMQGDLALVGPAPEAM